MSTTPASGPAGSRRFWVAVLCFALTNAAVWIGYDRFVRHRSHPLLEVAQSAPADQAQVWGRATFWWTFNLDVAPPVPNAPAPGTISPPVAGKWEWSNARTLNFVPDAPLSRATAYTVTLLPDRLQTTDGFRLAKPHVTAVHTAPLQVVRVRQVALDERDQLVLEVEFNDDVIPAEALQHLSVKTPENKPVAFRSHGEATAHSIRVITDPVPAPNRGNDVAYLKVEISPGLTGRSGPLGLTSAYADQVSVGSELIATGAHSYFAQRSDTVLRLQFNNPADPAILRPLLSVEPAVPFTVSRGYDGLELRGAFQPSTRYAIKIAQAPAGIPRASRPRADTLSVFVPDRAPSVWFEHDEGYLGSTGNRTLLAHAVNVAQLHATVTRIYDNNLVTWRNTRVGIDSVDQPIAERDIRLPALKNKTQDVRLSLDDLLSADQSRDGVYFVRLGTTSNIETDPDEDRGYGRWQAAATVTLSDIALTAKKGRTGVTVWATSLRTAEPLPGVRTRLYSSKNQFLGEAVTRDDGLATIVPVPTAEGEEPGVVLADRPDARSAGFTTTPNASSARDLTWLDLRGSRINFGESETTGASYLRTGHEAFVYTDRGVYRPGETVHLRAIVRGPDGATPPSFPVRWQFRRPDLHNWKSFDAKIDPDGAVSLDLLLPNDLPTGHWSVALGLPGNQKEEESFGSGSFQVEDFMPNRMQVGLKLDGTPAGVSDGQEPRFAATNEPLSAEVQADYLFGKPVSERPARLVARLDPATFSSPKWAGWTFGDSATTAQTLEGLKITGHRTELPEQTLDANGHAAFDLDLQSLLSGDETSVTPTAPKSKRSRRAHTSEPKVQGKSTTSYVGPWRLSVTASVIETGGRAVSASTQAQLDPVPWYIGVVPKNSSAAGSLDSSFELALVSPDGSIAARDLALDATLYRESWNNSL
ncbi:MAG TPA: MG2 domain-containing protein, partial [Tepidisphaeraceae bacterium]|nr:MG2 domain-containing protein [Tepidisphaeraceae bacterium]